jgi:hypothetical protein
MRTGFEPLLYLMAAVLLATGSSARAQAPDICWRAITLTGDAPVELRPAGDEMPELSFRATSSVTVELPGSPDTPRTIPAGEIVQLDASSGRIEIRKGPLELISASGRYAIPLDPSRLNLRLSAIEGTRIKLQDEVTGGKLPANKSAEVLFDDGPVQAQLVAPVSLKPAPPADPSARLEVGALPITRGGRTLQVELDAPGWNQDQLSDEQFQACFYDEAEDDQSASTSAELPATMASVVSAGDGRVVLTVPVPDEFDTKADFYNAVQLQILGPTLGTISNAKEVWIGNPIIAFIGSVVIVIVILVLIAYCCQVMSPSEAFSRNY